MKSYIFVDVDGTLLHHGSIIPDSAKQAIKTARQNGHAVYISTGRPKCELNEEIMEIGFDGFVACGGAYVENNGRVLYENVLSPKHIDALCHWMDDHHIGYALQGAHHTYLNELAKANIHDVFGVDSSEMERMQALISMFSSIKDFHHQEAIYKFCFYAWDDHAEALIKEHMKDYEIIFHHDQTLSVYGEVTNKGIVKSHGLQVILEDESADQSQSVAYGDSTNDMEMIRYAALGVCMGNGVDALKAIADDICPPVQEDGLYQSFKKYQFIA